MLLIVYDYYVLSCVRERERERGMTNGLFREKEAKSVGGVFTDLGLEVTIRKFLALIAMYIKNYDWRRER